MLRDPLFITSLFGTKAFNSPRVMKANVKSYPGGWGWLQVYERVGEFVMSVGKKAQKE